MVTHQQVWQNVVFQAMLSTCIAVFTTMLVVYISHYNLIFRTNTLYFTNSANNNESLKRFNI